MGERRTFQGIFGFAQAQVAGLLQSREGLVYARDGELVGEDVEVADCVVDELGIVNCVAKLWWEMRIPSLDPRREA
jgi:ABC-type amino acid transport substrate-binding protein